ncbi:ABC transporter permease [Arachidicoccus terrestris]|uniref:ABC transporter permease n=1 Tax=Arachidicoccus terrestris TaxID=2875539 RepID=UPI001CC6872C|nr:ABC transporter permease [Arachidicoccus terrestris]UAY56813.1 ABC transporter permease [Arachidicoccus terrestris]
MLKFYFNTAFRSLKRNRLFSGLNVLGLAIGMAGAILIGLWAHNMLSYDRFHPDEDRLFVLRCKGTISGEMRSWKWTPKILGPTLVDEMPGVEQMTRYDSEWDFLLTYGNKIIEGHNGSFADPGFFKMFDFPFREGGINEDWKKGNGIVLTEKFATALFGKQEALGRSIKIDSVNYVKVTGVLKDFPTNTMFNCNYLLSWAYAKKINAVDKNWFNNNVQTFVKIEKGTQLAVFNDKIKDIIRAHSDNANITYQLLAEPLSRNFLYDKDENGEFVTGRIVLVKSVILIGVFLVLIACINFMNLSTAQSEHRAKEVGVKKAIGATKKRLVSQFFIESLLLAFISFVLAIGLVELVLPFFNHLVGVQLSLAFSGRLVVVSLIFVLATGAIAGCYPAFYLSSFKPIMVLNGKFKRIYRKLNIRSVLVILQFTVSIVLMLGTIMLIKNIDYVRNRDIGYNNGGLLYSWLTGDLEKNYLPLKNALLQSGAVLSVTKNMSPVTESQSNGWGISWPGATPGDKKIQFIRFSTDADMVKTLGMHLLEGRDIDVNKFRSDSTAMVLTASAARRMKLKDPVGAIVRDNDVDWHVVGIIEDFIIDKPFERIKPMIIEGPRSWFDVMHYRLNPGRSTSENLTTIKEIFARYNPGAPFMYDFVDKSYQSKFRESERYRQISVVAAGMAIFISCLGLFGLMSYMKETRMKEIGIRKVLGASGRRIAILLSKGFMHLLFVSFLVSTPVALWVMHTWLSDMDYRVEISVWWFVYAFILSSAIATCTISYQAWKASHVNPVQSLKTE